MADVSRSGAGREADSALIAAAQAGDEQALDELMRIHLPGLRAFVRARSTPALRQREAESDLVQTVCREALQSLDNYEWRGAGSFRWWLFSVALNKMKRKWAHHAAEKRGANRQQQERTAMQLAELYGHVIGPSQHAIAAELVARFEAALDRLSDEHRELILMARVAGMSTPEIAVELGKSPDAVRVMLGRALARLADALDG